MAVNQKQIAERLGVSIAVVSRSLSGTAREIGISEETIERVRTAALEMGYVPNAAARALKGKASNTIGVVVYDFLDPFFGTTLERLQNVTHEEGYSLVLVGFQGRHPSEGDLTPLHKHVIDGLIVVGSASESSWLDDFSHLPVARIGHGGACEHGTCVSIDEEAAASAVLDHLISMNSNEGIFIGSDLYSHVLRYDAFASVASSRGLPLDRAVASEDGFAAGQQTVGRLLKEGREPAALICATDMIAMGALHALHDAGVQWPVTGFDDIPAASQFMPSITTVRQPMDEIVRAAVNSLIHPENDSKVIFKGCVIVRDSSQV
ncbi:MAG: LacI family DNA-binding transcriptional regulator [Pontiellaceae bacterium]|nr:LacI family DNA-binding transcriptional regulator [Pontiellaceae bacterium]MBN2783425.1 LacI family DNA-binding transcriptional regulator [Pontiellaceae bacterium]